MTGSPTVDIALLTKEAGVRRVPTTLLTGPTTVCRIACVEGVEPVVITVVPTTCTTVTIWGPEQVAIGGWVLLVVVLSEPEATVSGIADPELVM